MFFKNKIKKNIKLAVVLVLAVIVLTGGALSTFAAQEDPLSLGANGFELQSSSDTWTPINDGGQSLPPRPFVTSQLEKGTTAFGALTPSNYAYSKRSSGLESPSGNYGLYAVSTGKLDSGYSYTVVYDKRKMDASTKDDFVREIRIKDPNGKESVYIYTAKNEAGVTTKNGALDKEIISKIGAANGDADVYQKLVAADTLTHQTADKQAIIDEINNRDVGLSASEKAILIDKVNSGVPLSAAEMDLYKTRLEYGPSLQVTQSGFITTSEKLGAVANALAEDAQALKIAQEDRSALFLKNKNDGQCFRTGVTLGPPFFFIDIFNCISQVFYYALTVATMALSLVGQAFNVVFDITVVNMKPFVDSVGIITVGWVAIRDMANILFIFMLLYLAIATILQLDEHGVKHGLSRLIIGAVLINFSLFFVKVPVDISNILAIEIYQKINPSSAGGNLKMGDAILSSLNFQNVYGAQTSASSWGSDTIASAQAFAQTNAPTTTFIMAMIMIMVIILIFIAVIMVFVKRLVTIMMLMIFSPLAFAGIAIPNHSISHDIDSKFWGTLLRESFFAPVFMFIMYLGLMILNSEGFKVSIFGLNNGTPYSSFFGGVISTGTIINYIVVIFIFIFALSVSEIMGVKGADGAIKTFDGMRGYVSGWVGKNTIGRLADSTLQKGNSAVWLREAAAGQKGGNFATKFIAQQFARGAIATTSSLSKNKFGGDESYSEKVHHREEEYKAMIDELHDDPKAIAKLLTDSANDRISNFGTDRKAGDKLFHHLSGEQKLSVMKYLQDAAKSDNENIKKLGNNALKRYFKDHGHGRMTPDEALDLEKMERERISTYDKAEFRNEAFGPHGDMKDNNIDKAIERFSNFSDKQRTDILSSLAASDQDKLVKDEKFKKAMRLSLKNFDLIERVGKGPANSDAMKKLLGQIAYQKKARITALEAIEDTTDPNLKSKLEAIFGAEIAKMNQDLTDAQKIVGKDIDELITNYKKSEFYNEDLTLGKSGADKNLTRFLSQSDEYKALLEQIKLTGYKMSSK